MSANSGRVIENPSSGERIIVRQTAADTEGTMFSFDLYLCAGGRVPGTHTHPEQEERFTVLDGEMRFRLGLRTITAGPGTVVTIPRATAHAFANNGTTTAHVLVEVRPALRMEEFLSTAAALARDTSGAAHAVPRPLDLALFLREFEREVGVPFIPRAVVRVPIHMIARTTRWLRLDARYQRLRRPSAPFGRHGDNGARD